jgi:transcriptional regulator with XRE-family HTH domain
VNEVNEQVRQWLTRPTGLATRLRALCAQAGFTGKALAEDLGWPEYRVSKIFNGHKTPSIAEVNAITAACRADPDEARDLRALVAEAVTRRSDFRSRQKDGQADVQRTYNELVEGSTLIRHFEVAYVPGLLQTPDYARRVFEEQAALHGGLDDVDVAVATRAERQRWLYNPDKRFEFLLTESVLRFVLPSPDAMRAQLDRLQTVVGVGNIRFGVIPFGVSLPITPQGPIQLYDDLGIVEHYLGEDFYRGEDSARLARVFDFLWDEAIEGDAVRRMIVEAQAALRGVDRHGAIRIDPVP